MKARKEMIRMGTKIGAAFGGLAFLIFGLLPGFYFGSYGSLVVLQYLIGGPIEPTVLVRMFVAVGIFLGIASMAFLSIVVGAILGTAMGYAVEAVTAPKEVKETTEVAAEIK